MAVANNPTYRNRRDNYYTDKFPDSQVIGSIIQVLKSTEGSYDHSYVPTITPTIGGSKSYKEISGDAEPEDNPDYQYEGYIYCDGSEYYIHDYPALYEVIGNEYGGTASDGLDILTGGAGWGDNVTVTISAPPSGSNQIFEDITPVQATATATVVSGIITGVEITNPGKGYDVANPPTVTFSATNGGTTPTYALRISPQNGQIQSINKDNVFQYWPDQYMGTFKVPDLKAKRIVGNGPVYGSNTPNVGNSSLGVGLDTIDGKWYLDKDTQKGQFSLGNITTTGYTNVVETVEASIIGSQVISVELQEKKLAGAPQHSHFLFHCEAPQDNASPQSVSGDLYTVSYKPSTGKVTNFLPAGGIAKSHTHSLSKKPILDGSVGTYDLFNWSGGDPASGSLKDANNYYASGGANAGSYVEQTNYGTPTMKSFASTSLIGGRTLTTDGTPIYDTDTQQFTSNANPSVPSDIDQATITVVGGGGSGAVYSKAGNDGSSSSVKIGSNGSKVTITATGGEGGKAASASEGGAGGSRGSDSLTGSNTDDCNVIGTTPSAGDGGTGGDGKYWFKNIIAGNNDPADVPSGAEGAAGQGSADGTKGKSRSISDSNEFTQTFTYGGGNDQTFTPAPTNDDYYLTSLKFKIAGGGGRDCGNFGGNGCGTAGEGGGGNVYITKFKGALTTSFRLQPGQSGRVYNGQAGAFHSGKGGVAGNGYGSNDGGGGGAASVVRLQQGNVLIAGAGGGGGGGGFGEGSCGQNGRSAASPGNNVIISSEALESGTGKTGGAYGCTGGGGGGGGGGVSKPGQGAGGTAGAGGGGSGGHEEGRGGRRGLSAIRSQYFEDPTNESNTNTGNGYIEAIMVEDQSYWTSGGGGGGCGGQTTVEVEGSVFAGESNVTVTVGSGGDGVSQGGVSSSDADDGLVTIKWQTITGYEGGTTSISIGDVFIAGSGSQDNGVNFYASGTGSNSTNGFKLPTTQEPIVVFEGGGGGTGATATAEVSGNKVVDLDLTNPGSGYTQAPRVRILHGAGVKNYATVGFDPETGQLEGLTLQSSEVPTTYLKFGGTQANRFVVTDTVDASDIKRVTVKAARGNNVNGGEIPDGTSDQLLLYYNLDETLNFPNSQFAGVLVPIPTSAELNSNYDGDGSGGNATNWYTYGIDLPEAAKKENVRFQIRQNRATPSSSNDNASNTDNYGIIEITYENDLTTQVVFVASDGKIPVANDKQQYSVQGELGSTYTSGIFANDLTLTLSSAVPIVPEATLDPDIKVPLIEPYMLVKHLIKAY